MGSVIGDVTLCEKEAQFDSKKYNEVAGKPQKEKAPKKQQPKAEKKAAQKKEEAPKEPEAPKAKPADPWSDCGRNSSPTKSRPTTPSGRVPINSPTSSLCLSWLPILSEVCSNVLKSCASIASHPLLSVAPPTT